MGAPAAMGVGFGMQALGSILGGANQQRAANTANRRQQGILDAARGMQVTGPSDVEQSLLQLFQGTQGMGQYTPQLTDLQNILQGTGFNMGQDALMQMLRASPETQVDSSLNAILMGGGNPFDTSSMFDALHKQDATNIAGQVAGLQGSASGLGERFGSSMLQAQNNLRQNLGTQIAARDAGIQQGSYESAQSRLLQAAQQLSGREQFNTGMQANIANLLQQNGLSLGGLQSQIGSANNNAMAQAAASGLAGQGFSAGLLQNLLQAEQARRGFNLSTLGLQGSMNEPYTTPGIAGAFGGMGQMAMLYPFLMQMMNGGGNGAFPTSWAR